MGSSHGPEGGRAYAVAVAPSAPRSRVLGTGSGVFGAGTAGAAGQAPACLSRRYSSSPRGHLACGRPATPTTVYAGLNWRWAGGTTYHQPVYKTTNGGRTWRALDLRGQLVAITPHASAVYAAAGRPRGTSRLFRSTDGGRSWQPADRGLPSTYLWATRVRPDDAGDRLRGDGPAWGLREHRRRRPLASGGRLRRFGEVTAIAVDPRDPQRSTPERTAGVIKSLDGGRSWRMLNAAMGGHGRDRWYRQVTALVVDPLDSRTVYATTRCAGVFKSTDGGHRWSAANAGLGPQCPGPIRSRSIRGPRGRSTPPTPRAAYLRASTAARTGRDEQRSRPGDRLLARRRPAEPADRLRKHGCARPLQERRRRRPLAAARDRPQARRRGRGRPKRSRKILADRRGGNGIARSTDAGRTWTGASLGRPRWVNVVAISGKTAYAGSSTGAALREHRRRPQLARTRPCRGVITWKRSRSHRKTGRRLRRRPVGKTQRPLQEHRRRQPAGATASTRSTSA